MANQTSPSDAPQAKQPWKVPLNDLSRSWLASPEAQEVLCKVAASGIYSLGPQVAAFEEEFATYLGVAGVVGVASGTAALEIALRTVGCDRGDTIVSVANAGGYTSIAAAQIGVRVRYCDVDPHSLLMTAETLNEVLTPQVKAVVVTHLYGNVVDMDPIVEICESRGIALVEDCAQATGATYKGTRVGGIGDIGAFSFYPTKNLGCMGDGGAIVSSNRNHAGIARQLRQYGWTARYEIGVPGGTNSRLDEVQAALLRIGLRHLDAMNAARVLVKEKYRTALAASRVHPIASPAEDKGVAHLVALLCPSAEERVRARETLTQWGVQTDIHYPIPDHMQAGLVVATEQPALPVTRSVTRRAFTIPAHPFMSQEEVGLVISALEHFVQA